MKFLKFSRKQTERGYKILKFLGARRFVLQRAAELLNLTPAPLRNRFGILKFTRTSAHLADTAQNFISQRGLRILKLICEPPRASRRTLPRADKAEAGRAARLTSQHTYDATEKRRAVKLNQYLNSVRRRIVGLRSAAARHGHEVGSAENFSKFDLTGALLNFISLSPCRFKLALLKFSPEVPRNRSEILNFMFASYKLKLALRKFTLAPRKFKSVPTMRLNFTLNSAPQARAAKFENGVKFKGAAKFKRGVR